MQEVISQWGYEKQSKHTIHVGQYILQVTELYSRFARAALSGSGCGSTAGSSGCCGCVL